MAKFKSRSVIIEAAQWFKNGNHPLDYAEDRTGIENGEMRVFRAAECKANGWEGAVVRYFRHPEVPGARPCAMCGVVMHDHGWIDIPVRGYTVCPGDWIITDANGFHYPCKPYIFKAIFEPEE